MCQFLLFSEEEYDIDEPLAFFLDHEVQQSF